MQTPLQFLKGVGPRKAADLKKAGLNTVEDLLFRFPRRYEDRSKLQQIISLRPGMTAAITGKVLNAGLAQTRRPGFRLFSALVQDDSGQIQAVWPNQAFLKDVIRSQQRIVLFGKVEVWGSRGLQITDPEVVRLSGKAVHIIARETGDPADRIAGILFELSEAELAESKRRIARGVAMIEEELGTQARYAGRSILKV